MFILKLNMQTKRSNLHCSAVLRQVEPGHSQRVAVETLNHSPQLDSEVADPCWVDILLGELVGNQVVGLAAWVSNHAGPGCMGG